ncbi:lipid-A-disaccharide synthase [Persicobacter sp. CCB-QB2]|uniref:lipid-A-disaccharide synthase n=1 Tax=Persicobacter sp. CCB-QB2 TaxID=1561025 RepID=UPI0006A9AAFF|nr:lipid-A-disaccharide synthase [Persicobacter sp. CCB-QB2]
MKYYLIAGERSGDLHGGNLIRAIKNKDANATFRFWGGDQMEEASGEKPVTHYRDTAFMGVVEVLANLRTIQGFLKKCKADVMEYQPDVLILIDYAGFNLKIAEFAKSRGLKVYYYISPKVWAWNTKRAWKLKKNVDRMFCIMPFEKEFYAKFDWEVDYVGNPVVDAVQAHQVNPDFRKQNGLSEEQDIIALLPGSRKMELKNMLPTFAEIAKKYHNHQFVVAAVENLDPALYTPISSLPNVKLVTGQTYDLYANAKAALVTSGTATLETALWKVPQVVCYRINPISYHIMKFAIKISSTIKYIALMNLILDKEAIKELIQDKMTVENISQELDQLLDENSSRRKEIMADYERNIEILGTEPASVRAADKMWTYLN